MHAAGFAPTNRSPGAQTGAKRDPRQGALTLPKGHVSDAQSSTTLQQMRIKKAGSSYGSAPRALGDGELEIEFEADVEQKRVATPGRWTPPPQPSGAGRVRSYFKGIERSHCSELTAVAQWTCLSTPR